MSSAILNQIRRQQRRRQEALALANRPKRGRCRDCRAKREDELCGGRCLSCWAVAAQQWSWNGMSRNAFKHARRN